MHVPVSGPQMSIHRTHLASNGRDACLMSGQGSRRVPCTKLPSPSVQYGVIAVGLLFWAVNMTRVWFSLAEVASAKGDLGCRLTRLVAADMQNAPRSFAREGLGVTPLHCQIERVFLGHPARHLTAGLQAQRRGEDSGGRKMPIRAI